MNLPFGHFRLSPGAMVFTTVVFLMAWMATPALSQEHGFGKEEIGAGHESVSEHNTHDSDHLKSSPAMQDTMPVLRAPAGRPKSKNSESTASQHAEAAKFNFLYFIFEKFKITDIIE